MTQTQSPQKNVEAGMPILRRHEKNYCQTAATRSETEWCGERWSGSHEDQDLWPPETPKACIMRIWRVKIKYMQRHHNKARIFEAKMVKDQTLIWISSGWLWLTGKAHSTNSTRMETCFACCWLSFLLWGEKMQMRKACSLSVSPYLL